DAKAKQVYRWDCMNGSLPAEFSRLDLGCDRALRVGGRRAGRRRSQNRADQNRPQRKDGNPPELHGPRLPEEDQAMEVEAATDVPPSGCIGPNHRNLL